MVFNWIFVLVVATLWVVRGMRKAERSGYRFYIYTDAVLAFGWVVYFGIYYNPQLIGQEEPGFWILGLLLVAILAASFVEFKGRQAAEAEDSKRWKLWEEAMAKLPFKDRFLWRFPSMAELEAAASGAKGGKSGKIKR